MNYVLDACAMIALLLQEPGEEVVWAHLLEKDATCWAHSINLCEVFYNFHRESSEAAALGQLADGIILVLAAHRTRRATARKVLQTLRPPFRAAY